ncbi:MAG: hypothetical protein KA534_06245, partial [Sediminibacterium sp.]|nr:hypothetical protein [Sediminibacterium sp.]
WVLDDIRPLRKLAKAQAAKYFMSVPPAAINLSIKNSPYEWSTWGMWDAPNKPTGMPITIYSMDSAKKAKVQIKDAADNVIRNLSFKLDSGFNRNYWGFEQKGKRGAGAPKTGGGFGRRMAEESADAGAAEEREFTGREVLPGTYKVVVTVGSWKDSAMVQVSDDPRLPSKREVVLAQDKLIDQLQKTADKYNAAQDQLDDADLILTQLKAEWKDKKDKGVDSLNKAHKIITEKVKNLKEMMVGKKQEKQGYGTVPTITPISIIRSASMLIMGKNTMPGTQEERVMADAATAAEKVATQVNAFFAKDWADFRKLVEATPIKKFKEVEAIK